MKKEQERKAQERRRIIQERCGQPKSLDGANEGRIWSDCFLASQAGQGLSVAKLGHSLIMKCGRDEWFCDFSFLPAPPSQGKLREVAREYHERIAKLQSEKWDQEFDIRKKDCEVAAHTRFRRLFISFLPFLLVECLLFFDPNDSSTCSHFTHLSENLIALFRGGIKSNCHSFHVFVFLIPTRKRSRKFWMLFPLFGDNFAGLGDLVSPTFPILPLFLPLSPVLLRVTQLARCSAPLLLQTTRTILRQRVSFWATSVFCAASCIYVSSPLLLAAGVL